MELRCWVSHALALQIQLEWTLVQFNGDTKIVAALCVGNDSILWFGTRKQ